MKVILTGVGDLLPSHYHVSCFIKNESYDKYKIPRAILARTDEFKCFVGPVFHMMQKFIFSMKNPQGKYEYIKNISFSERAKYLSEKFGDVIGYVDRPDEHLPRILITDFTSFEASFSKNFMEKCEFKLYEFFLNGFIEKDEIMIKLNKILGQNFLKFSSYLATITARRMSGEMNTSLGNGFSNNMMIKFSLYMNGIEDFELIVEGDDSLTCYNGPMITERYFKLLGFIIKMKFVTAINLGSFCGQIYDPLSFVVITDPIKFVLNFPWLNMKFKGVQDSYIMDLLRGKALCALYQYAGCPIVQEFVVRVLQITDGYNVQIDHSADQYKQGIYREMLQHYGVDLRPRPVTLSVRLLMSEHFGISITDQLLMESIFMSMDLDTVVCPPLLSYCHPDCLDYFENYVRFGGVTKHTYDYDFYF